MMVLAKSKNAVGLGNSLMNDRFGRGKGNDRKKVSAGIHRTDQSGQTYVTNAPKEAAWVKMRSVTEQGALDEFLSTAELAGTDFTAEKMNNVKIIHTDQRNPYLLSAAEERSAIKKQIANKNRLTVPRRPPWDASTTPQDLDQREKASLLDWRRGLAELQDNDDLLMTPFERNLEVWRQLWRVIERSDLVVQIVDARNPLLFRSEDLEKYVKEVDTNKNNLLLVNKADMMTFAQREAWAEYFKDAGINFRFFSASLAKERNESMDIDEELVDERPELSEKIFGERADAGGVKLAEESANQEIQEQEEDEEQWASEEDLDEEDDPGTRILSTDELEALFLANAPDVQNTDGEHARKTIIGLVGYPNVGKSSTINALIGAKKVSVSSTPGKTKHFQTIHLSPQVLLCDCPGLVFPNFATTKAELVCNGILPIDQLREFSGPAGLVAQRIPQSFFEALYGVKVQTRPLEEGGTGIPTAEEILTAYAIARGFATTGQGQPDQSRAARYVLKDYVSGKLLFCQPPPQDPSIDAREFNRELYDVKHLPQKRQAMLAAQAEASMTGSEDPSLMDDTESLPAVPLQGEKSNRLDKKFFGPGQGSAGHLKMPFNHQYSEQGRKQIAGRKLTAMTTLEKGIDPAELKYMNSKKHFKGNRRKGIMSKTDFSQSLFASGVKSQTAAERIPIIARHEVSDRAKETLNLVEKFVEEECVPADDLFHAQLGDGERRWSTYPPMIDELKARAKKMGLWNLFLPKNHFKEGAGFSNLEYGLMAEYLGRCRTANEATNCAAPDTGNMEVLAKYGNEAQKKQWLTPLLNGDIRSAFLMTEPDVASSDATNITLTMTRQGNDYVLNGSKWWSSGAGDPRCKIYIVMGKSDPNNKNTYKQQSVILVPAGTKGVTVKRVLSVYGFDDAPHGHAHITFDNVRVPASNIVLGEGRGFEIIQGRLGPGRIHHCMRSIGAAEKALEWMVARVNDPRKKTFGKPLSEHGVIIEWIAKSRMEIDASRLVVLNAAMKIDEKDAKNALKEISEAKVLVPSMALTVIDRAVQSYGGAGVCQDTPLAGMWAGIRTLRMADGPDEVHLQQMGRNENKRAREVMEKLAKQKAMGEKLVNEYWGKAGKPKSML